MTRTIRKEMRKNLFRIVSEKEREAMREKTRKKNKGKRNRGRHGRDFEDNSKRYHRDESEREI